MAVTGINSEDTLVQRTFANHLEHVLGWENVYAFNEETFGAAGTLGRRSEQNVVLGRDLREALERLNPDLPPSAWQQAIDRVTRVDFARSVVQHNREFYDFLRGGVPVEWRDGKVRQGQRSYPAYDGKEYDVNLTGTCLTRCHGGDHEKFCDRCHSFAGVPTIDCWGCHAAPPTPAVTLTGGKR